MMIIEWQVTGRLGGQAMTLIVINLVFGFVFNGLGGNVSIGGHIGGLIGGILITLGYAHWSNRRRVGSVTVELGAILVLVPWPSRASRSRTSASTATSSASPAGAVASSR